MVHISDIVDYVKARLGVSHRKIELEDQAIIRCLVQETLRNLSIYAPFYCYVTIDLDDNETFPGMNTYHIPEDANGDFTIMGVEKALPMDTGRVSSSMYYMPAGSDLQSITTSLAMTKLGNTLLATTTMPTTHEFIPPNMVRLSSNYTTRACFLICRTTHRKDFSTFPMGFLDTIKELALYDVALDIHGIRKHFANVQTLFAQIQLDMNFYEQIPDKRRELVDRLRRNQQKWSTTRKIIVA